jgi:hypothetical protein
VLLHLQDLQHKHLKLDYQQQLLHLHQHQLVSMVMVMENFQRFQDYLQEDQIPLHYLLLLDPMGFYLDLHHQILQVYLLDLERLLHLLHPQ